MATQWLTGRPARSVTAVVDRLLAVQAQDARGFPLALRARSSGLHLDDLARALADRELVVSWLNRGTLHLVRAGDYPLLQALTTPQLQVGNERRLRQTGVSADDAERGVAVVVAALTQDGPLLRADLRQRVAAAGVPVAGQALVHLLMLTALRGLTVRGPLIGAEQAFVLTADWLPAQSALPAVEPEQALAELARRYLVGHAPATAADLAAWAGLSLGAARRGVAALGSAVRADSDGLLRLDVVPDPPTRRLPAPVLLGPFDPVLHGWPNREWVIGQNTELVTINGIFRPVVLVGGRAVGTWRMPRGRVELDLFEPVSAAVRDELEADAADLARYLRRG